MERFEHAGPFGLVGGKFSLEAAASSSVYHAGRFEEAVAQPDSELTRGETGGCAEFDRGH